MPDPIHVWVKPPTLQLPTTGSSVRFAVGSPEGASSNSWKVWTTGPGDAYVACRDNFRELKVSLHVSGQWRIGFTEHAVSERPNLLPPGADRAWDKWQPPEDHETRLVVAFEVVFPTEDLYLQPDRRVGWKPVVFVESHPDPTKMIVASICVVPSTQPIVSNDVSLAVLGILPISGGRSIQTVARVEAAQEFRKVRNDALQRIADNVASRGHPVPPDGVVFMVGTRGDGVRYVTATRHPGRSDAVLQRGE